MDISLMAAKEVKEGRIEPSEISSINKLEMDRPLFGGENAEAGRDGVSMPTRPQWTDGEKREKQLESGWPDSIMDSIRSDGEYNIYRTADVQAAEIGTRPCLVRLDLDMERVDAMGNTNKQRMERGLAPLNGEGKPIELHHIGQRANSPLAELTMEEHRGKGNDAVLHDKTITSEIDRNQFNMEKADHWKLRAATMNGEGR